MPTQETPPVEMKMQPEEFAELRARVAVIAQQDIHLGRVLDLRTRALLLRPKKTPEPPKMRA